jgi:hypothetical protein
MPANRSRRPEPLNATGAVLLGYNQLALLHGLYDRPEGRATSTADLARAAIPYVRVFRAPDLACLEKAALSLHPAWVERVRDGYRNTWTLTPRGRAIIERSVPVYLRSRGTYEGFAEYLEMTNERRRQEYVDARIEAMALSHDGRELLARIEAAMYAFSCFFRPVGFCSGLAFEGRRRRVLDFVRTYVARQGAMPQGIHDVGITMPDATRLDFDLLIGMLPTRGGTVTLENTGRYIIVRPTSNFVVKRLRMLAREGAEWKGDALHCEPAVVSDIVHAMHST